MAERRLSELSLLDDDEHHRVLVAWNATATPFPSVGGVHELFADQAQRQPEAAAVVVGDETVSYGQLASRAHRLARYLRGRGVGPDVVVGVCLSRSVDLVVALLGVLEAGGVFMPLDPEYPVGRLAYMVRDSRVSVLLGRGAPAPEVSAILAENPGAGWLDLTDPAEAAAIAAESDEPVEGRTHPDQLAYVMYTSGSTGRPKGVLITHRGVANLLAWRQDTYRLQPHERVLHHTAVGVDIATSEMLWPLTVGAGVVVADPGRQGDVDYLVEVMRAGRVAAVDWVPSLFQLLIDHPAVESLPHLRLVICGGEALAGDDVAGFYARNHSAVVEDIYGSTEATIDVTSWRCERPGQPGSAVPIGRPIANMRVYVLDPQLSPVPVGVPGELYVGGVGVARGYGHRPALTAERFVADPFGAAGDRLYRIGDRVRWRDDGGLEYLGRIDGQLNVRGFRIEPGEIEAALLAHPDVAAAVVVAQDDSERSARLVAYLVPADAAVGAPARDELRTFLAASLPAYMVPGVFVELDQVPVTPYGKVDRAALPVPDRSQGDLAPGFVAPRTVTEEVLAGVWADVLGHERVGVDDDFFDLGGHSLLATQVVSRLRTVFDVELPLAELFDHPTVRGLADVVDGVARGGLAPPIVAVGRDRPLPLSFAQQRLWFLDQLEPGSADFNLPSALRLAGPVDVAALRAAVAAIVARHEVLRTRLVATDGVPYQVIDPPGGDELEVVDLRGQPDALARAEALVAEDAAAPFDLAAGPLFRARLVRVAAEDHILSIVVHHVVSDEWSAKVLNRELTQLYDAFRAGEPPPLVPLPVQYADFAMWQRQLLQGPVLDQQLDYWRERLAGAARLELPTDRPRPPVWSSEGGVVEFDVPDESLAGLREVSRAAGATMFMTLLSGLQVLLGRYADQDDVVVGTRIANRNRAEVEDLIGFFVNTLVIRTDLSGDPSLGEVLARVRGHALGGHAHQDLPFEQVVDALESERDRSRSPLFQVLFDYAQADGQSGGPEGDADRDSDGAEPGGPTGPTPPMAVSEYVEGPVAAQFDLRVMLIEGEDHLSGAVEYSSALFDGSTVVRLVGHLLQVLATMATKSATRLSGLSLVDEAGRDELVARWNATDAAVPAVAGVHELVAAQATRDPAALAVAYGDEALTYGELDARANRLAHHLRAMGVGPDVVVGLCAHRSLDMVVALLGVLKSGGAYLPLDPGYPPERLAFMLSDSRVSVLVGHGEALEALPAQRARVVLLDDPATQAAVAAAPAEALTTPPARPDQLAYVIYTSGSTGRPKGVMVTHRGVVNLVGALRASYGVGPGDVALQFAPFSFDTAVWDVFMALGTGAALRVATPAARAEPARLAELVVEGEVTLATFPPSLLAVLDPATVPGLATVISAGERLSPELADRWTPGRRMFNSYGPTETTVGVATCQVVPELYRRADGPGPVPIGQPSQNTRLYVLDRSLGLAPPGVPGELYAGGAGVARGYVHRPALTAERFVADPLAGDGSRLYRTGDQVAWRATGVLDFHGRVDEQVKVRGYRVEPGEVESALLAHPAVAAAAVVAHGQGEERRLVAYLVPDDPALGVPSTSQLRTLLARSLPPFMVPAAFVELDRLPLSPNGKVDRTALPAPGSARPQLASPFAAAQTPTEEVVTGLWTEVLGIERVGIDDSFFDLGGHSLLATQVISRLREVFGVELALAALFDHPTVAGLARVIDSTARGGLAPPLTPVDRDRPLPLSFAQQRLWFLDQLEPGSVDYLVPAALRLTGPLDVPALGRAVEALVERHEVLRTRLVAVDGVSYQMVDPPGGFALETVDLSGEADPEARAEALVAEDGATPFDLATGPLLRGRLLRLGVEDHLLSLVMHHVVCDEWSAQILESELALLYDCLSAGEPSPLAPLPVQYADFAVWQRDWLRGDELEGQLAYWRDRLAGAPVLELPTDRPRPPVRSSAGDVVEFRLPEATVEALRVLSREASASLFMTLLAGFGVVLGRYSGQDDVVVGTLIANRNRAEIEGLIGFFVNTLVMRTDLSGDPTFAELVARVRGDALGAYAHQDVPFEQLVEDLHPERDRSRTPLFQVLMEYEQGGATSPRRGGSPEVETAGPADIPELAVADAAGPSVVALFDLTLAWGDDGRRGLLGALQYSVELFERPTVERLVADLVALLETVGADPGRALSALPALPEAIRHQVLADWNATAVDAVRVVAEATGLEATAVTGLPALVAAHAARHPDLSAVRFSGTTLSYRELDSRADQLAHHLRQRGVGPEVVVGVCLPRGVDLVVATLAVLRAGGACLPLDPSYPAERLAFMVADSRAPVVVGPAELVPEVAARVVAAGVEWVEPLAPDPVLAPSTDEPSPVAAAQAATPVAGSGPADPRQVAWVIYTSGSTGPPKGVLVTHGGLVNVLAGWIDRCFTPQPGLRWLSLTSMGFDVFTGDLMRSLGAGGTLVVAPERLLLSIPELAQTLRDQRIEAFECAPRFADDLVEHVAAHGQPLDALRHLLVTTDTWRTSGVRRARAVLGPDVRVQTAFGLTETTIDSTSSDLASDLAPGHSGQPASAVAATTAITGGDPGRSGTGSTLPTDRPTPMGPLPPVDGPTPMGPLPPVDGPTPMGPLPPVDGPTPIGTPLANTQVYVLDAGLAPVPVGAVGELYIGGAGVSRGYGQRPALTAQRFVANPFGRGDRLYRTGDRARWHADGQLEFRGRIDHQANIRGYRVEPGEVEAALLTHPEVSAAVVVSRDPGQETARLVAYLVPADAAAGAPSTDELRGYLGERLPDFMLPAQYVEMAAVPLTPNGKVDRAALPDAGESRPALSGAFVAPRTVSEELLAGVWAEVLGVDRIGVEDNFFDLGGHSLLATQVVSRLRQVFEVELALAELFDHPTVGGLAAVVDGAARAVPAPAITPVERVGPLPLSFAQQRLWFLDQLEPGSSEYNVPLFLGIDGPVDVPALEAALGAVVERHEVLRTRLVGNDGVAEQVIDPPGDFQLEVVDLSDRPDAATQGDRLLAEDAETPFDLATGPLFRGRLLRVAADRHIVSLVLHHVVCDEWSAGLLRRELTLLYEAFREGRPSPLAPLAVQYADFAVWQRQWLQGEVVDRQLDYWRHQLAGAAILDLPTDRPRPPVRTTAGASVQFEVPAEVVDALRRVGRQAGATMFMTLLAGFKVLLGRYADQDDVVVGTPIANRNRAETEDLVGFFVNALVLRTDLAGDPTFAEVVGRVRQTALGAFSHQDIPFEQLVDALERDRDRSRTPLFQVLFNYEQDEEGEDGEAGGGVTAAKYDLRLILVEGGGRLTGAFEYSRQLFDPATVERMVEALRQLLETVATEPGRHLSELPPLAPAVHDPVEPDHDHEPTAAVDIHDPHATGPAAADVDAQDDGPTAAVDVHDQHATSSVAAAALAGAAVADPADLSVLAAAATAVPKLAPKAPESGAFGANFAGVPAHLQADAAARRRVGVRQLVADQAALRPDAAAVVDAGTVTTYGQLDATAGRLANYLRAQGVGPEVVVALCMPRGVDLVVAILGVLEAGGAYLPLDPDHPAERLAFMLADSRSSLLLGPTDVLDALPVARARLVYLDDPATTVAIAAASPAARTHPIASPSSPDDSVSSPVAGSSSPGTGSSVAGRASPGRVDADQLAYLIYTSGSTGRPKGVAVTQGALAAYTAAAVERLGLAGEGARYGLLQSPVVDFANTVLFGCLTVGGCLHVAAPEVVADPALLRRFVADQAIDYLKIVPSHLAALGAEAGLAELLPARTLVLGGEGAPPTWVRHLVEVADGAGVAVFNHYGPTETTVGVAAGRLSRTDLALSTGVPAGRALAGSRLLVLDRSMRPQPVGVPGELFVGGVGLARGYAGQPEQTAERFVPDPFAPSDAGGRLYRTGDRARWRSDGQLELLGRIDDQLKIRGYRIEPAEVETALVAHPAIAAATVQIRSVADDRQLVAYVTPEDGAVGVPSAADLRAHLGASLLEPMVPGAFVELASLPLLPSGKVDRAALPAPETVATADVAEVVTPRTPTEEALIGVWAEVLGLDHIGVNDNFFDLSGHSLLVTRAVARARSEGYDLSVTDFYDFPTVATLAGQARIGEAARQRQVRSSIVIRRGTTTPALFCVHEVGGGASEYHRMATWFDPNQRCYGLQSRGLVDDAAPLETVPEMATAYLAEVEGLQPEGPYLFAGFSMGCSVAFEMASQAVARGQAVAGVFMIGAPLLPREKRLAKLPIDRATRGVLDQLEQALVATPHTRLPADLEEQLLDDWQLREDEVARLRQGNKEVLRLLRVAIRNRSAAAHYHATLRRRPKRYAGRVVLFMPADDDRETNETAIEHWRDALGQVPEVITLPGYHHTIIGGAGAELLGRSLAEEIRRVQT